jgi:hypothetical protein
VLSGDVGYTEINPDNATEWFIENYRFNPGIQRCATGTSCKDSQFETVISSAQVAGDTGGFYVPFVLDPQNAAKLILGTCRVWRVPSNGLDVPANALSQTFDGSAVCSQDSPTVVTTITAGGPANASGSSVLYAGTADGQVYATTNAVTAQTNWTQVSLNPGFTNFDGYPISGIAIDGRDPSGKSAYVTVMGFNTPHVLQTTDAGSSWTDITGNLPDSPADGVVVDSTSGIVYVATDVGVYSANNIFGMATQWAEVGPITGSGTLPNVAITRIAIFNPAGQPPRLRVATYGRGVWETPLPKSTAPDFAISVNSADVETFPGQPANITGRLTTFNAYNSTVTLSCTATMGISGAVPHTCTPNAIDSSGNFAVSVADPNVQDFVFQIEGTDGTLTRRTPVTVRVVDFGLGVPNPASISNLNHGDNATVKSVVSSMGSFAGTVTVDCDPATLPAGLTCSQSQVNLAPGGSAEVTVTLSTAASLSAGSYSPTIRARSSTDAVHTAQHTVTLPVKVVALPGFFIAASNLAKQKLVVGEQTTSTITLSANPEYPGGTVSLSCLAAGSGLTGKACTFWLGSQVVTTITLGKSPVTVSLQVSTAGGIAGGYSLSIEGSDATNHLTGHASLPLTLTDFKFGATQSVSASAGNTTTIKASLIASSGYSGTVLIKCDASSLGLNTTCVLNPTDGKVQLLTRQTAAATASIQIPSNAAAGAYAIKLTGEDISVTSLKREQLWNVHVATGNPNFVFSFASSSVTAKAGDAIAPIALTTTSQGGLSGSVQWAVAGCPSLATCTISPDPTLIGQNATLTLTTTAASVSGVRTNSGNGVLALLLTAPLGALGLTVVSKRRTSILLAIAFGVVLILVSCGGGGGVSTSPPVTHPGTPAGTYTIVVTGTAGNIQHSQNFILTVQ